MKIEVKTRGSKEFYDEMLYVITYWKKFVKNPKKKAWQYSKYLCLFMVVSALMCGAFVALYLTDGDWYSLVMIGAFVILFLFTLSLFIAVKKRIKIYLDDKSDKTIDINENCISYSSDTMNLKMNKEDISVIIINNNSICILPKQLDKFAISISMDYLDEFLKGTSENEYDSIIVNNDKS